MCFRGALAEPSLAFPASKWELGRERPRSLSPQKVEKVLAWAQVPGYPIRTQIACPCTARSSLRGAGWATRPDESEHQRPPRVGEPTGRSRSHGLDLKKLASTSRPPSAPGAPPGSADRARRGGGGGAGHHQGSAHAHQGSRAYSSILTPAPGAMPDEPGRDLTSAAEVIPTAGRSPLRGLARRFLVRPIGAGGWQPGGGVAQRSSKAALGPRQGGGVQLPTWSLAEGSVT